MHTERTFEQDPTNHDAVQAQLALLRQNLSIQNYPHYPETQARFFAHKCDLSVNDGRLVLPDGPWVVDNYPGQRMPERNPNDATQRSLQAKGIELDTAGRPIHPWLEAMVADPSIGIVMGKGAYWHWGPNYTADSIVICQDHVLLVKRKDTGLWALPGGHLDPGEEATAASVRELAEETGMKLPVETTGTVVYSGPVVDLRVTAHAWPETTAVLYQTDQSLPAVEGMDDAAAAAWVPLEIIAQQDTLFGSHRYLLDQALLHLKDPS